MPSSRPYGRDFLCYSIWSSSAHRHVRVGARVTSSGHAALRRNDRWSRSRLRMALAKATASGTIGRGDEWKG